MINKKPNLTELVLRDGQQSLIATRMSIKDMIPILPKLNKVGYESIEVWGGATYDCCLRYLNEDPWVRLSIFKKYFKNTKLQMLLRGQNIVGYKRYDDSVLEIFINNLGWVAFDPSHKKCIDDKYIRISTGFDFEDASIIKGVKNNYNGDEFLDTKVNIESCQ